MERLKILQIVRSLDPRTGGPVHAVHQMSNILTAMGISVDIATTSGNDGITTPSAETSVRVFQFQRQIGRTWSFSIPLWRWLRANIQNYDVVHITGVFTFPAYIGARLAMSADVPYVVGPAGTLDTFAIQQKALKKRLFFYLFVNRILQRANAVHATSAAERRGLAALGVRHRCVVIPLSVELPDRRTLRAELSTLKLGIVARIHPIKAIPSLIEAVGILSKWGRSVHLTIAGGGAAEYLQELRQLVDRLGLQDIVDFPGFVAGAEKAKLLQRMDLFVLPSYQESFGIAAAEAMASGLPVVVSDKVALADEILAHEAGAVVPVDAPEQLAKCIDRFFDNDYRLDTGTNARRLVEQKFSAEDQGQQLLKLYRNIIGSGRAGHTN